MGKKAINPCGQIIRILFLILNIFFVLVGLALIAGGVYLLIVGDTYEFFTENEYAAGAPILIVCGVVSFLIAIVGIIAAAGLWWPLLLLYSIVLTLVVILEITAAILGFAFQGQLEEYYANVFNRTIFDYQASNDSEFQQDVNSFVDAVQNNFDCCGVFDPRDWLETSYYVDEGFPDSCMCESNSSECIVIDNTLVYRQGCNGSFFDFVTANAVAIGAVGLGFGLCEVLGVVFGFILCCCVFQRRNSDEWGVKTV